MSMKLDGDQTAAADQDVIDDYAESVKDAMRVIECPVCRQQVAVLGLPDNDGVMEYHTKVVRRSCLEKCPRCECSKYDTE